jgi:CheY-like chemotaxis protein
MTAVLERIRVLVVEDEFLVATLIEDMLMAAGCVVAGPIPRLSEALDAVDRGTFDAAVLDVNLGGRRVRISADHRSARCRPSEASHRQLDGRHACLDVGRDVPRLDGWGCGDLVPAG